MSNKVKVRFDLRMSVNQFEIEVDEDRAKELMERFEENNSQDYEDIEDLLDLSNYWPDIVIACNNIEVEDATVVKP